MLTAVKCLGPKGFIPVRRIRDRKVLTFVLANSQKVSFYDDNCKLCKFLNKPVSCRNHIKKHFVDEDPLFRMNLSLLGSYRNCTVNNKLSIVQWKPNWWVTKKAGPKLSREAKVLWIQLKKFLGEKTDEGYYALNGFISDNEHPNLFRKCLKYGLIKKDIQDKWVIDKPEDVDGLDEVLEEEKQKKNRRVKK